jgi:ATP-dependent Clp protease ATP-binding subunit ClpA
MRQDKAAEINSNPGQSKLFMDALKQIATASSASSRAAIEASKATKPSLHTRFVYGPAKDRA